MTEAEKELKAYQDRNVANKRTREAGAQMPDSYTSGALAKALALMQQEKYADAIKAYDAYLKISPIDSDLLVLRAEAKIKNGDKNGAADDYRTALKYIPDYQPALDGLKQIGASK
jgi:tetratricopeptide (TPR) repeat protein